MPSKDGLGLYDEKGVRLDAGAITGDTNLNL